MILWFKGAAVFSSAIPARSPRTTHLQNTFQAPPITPNPGDTYTKRIKIGEKERFNCRLVIIRVPKKSATKDDVISMKNPNAVAKKRIENPTLNYRIG